MSWEEDLHGREVPPSLETLIVPRVRDLGDGFTVRRALPSARRRMVGPFIFLDQMGPADFDPGRGLDVRPHPHIGLSTVTYLFEGEILHRDSLGVVQSIRPGAVNWMTAGQGIVHSERTGPDTRAAGGRLFGIQAWLALPKQHEETAPAFVHHPTDTLPVVEGDGVRLHVIAGEMHGGKSPVRTHSALFYADARLDKGARLKLPAEHEERGLYLVEGSVEVEGTRFEPGELLVFKPGSEIVLGAGDAPARMMLLGGEPMDGQRYLFWNFVSSSQERLEAAKKDWKEGRFGKVPQETEFIPLPPDDPPAPVRYP
ncbi:pirin family protein [Corallococcus llansteffanensis]|uniref:Pirin family protein n=1 Tax=Corallococcus llansteffanensis TaxID=2316731 RepID=A0A3A8QH51_9BACT|nr:pirin family protein [Corallococcus llansteffanensis]RKH67288.1 pirin family protein [Corallococcus llansteffanensis]